MILDDLDSLISECFEIFILPQGLHLLHESVLR